MDTQYLTEQILDELTGGVNYMKLALEERVSKPTWSKNFFDMAQMEMGHATKLYTMLNEHIESLKTIYKDEMPEYIKEHHRLATKYMTEHGAQIKTLQELYK